MIGLKCRKKRGSSKEPKPFKSKSKINTIKGVTINPHTGLEAFTFEEDDSCVDVRTIVILEEKNEEIQ